MIQRATWVRIGVCLVCPLVMYAADTAKTDKLASSSKIVCGVPNDITQGSLLPRKEEKIEKDIHKAKGWESYDPKHDTWGRIDTFQDLALLKDPKAAKPQADFLYYNFWAYDPKLSVWRKVDIASSLRLHGPRTPWWWGLGMDIGAGVGGVLYNITMDEVDLVARTGELHLQHRYTTAADKHVQAQGKVEGIVVKAGWFSAHEPMKGFKSQAAYTIASYAGYLRGLGLVAPVHTRLHYTFLRRFRLGMGWDGEFNYFTKLQASEPKVPDFVPEQSIHYRSVVTGLLGYCCYMGKQSKVWLEVEPSRGWDLGGDPLQAMEDWQCLHAYYGAGVGVRYEKPLATHAAFFCKAGVQCTWSTYDPFARIVDDQGKSITIAAQGSTNDPSVTIVRVMPSISLGLTLGPAGRDRKKQQEDTEPQDLAKVHQASSALEEGRKLARSARERAPQHLPSWGTR